METVFGKLGYSVSETRCFNYSKEIKLLTILNEDGSKKYIWPRNQKKPLFLKFRLQEGLIPTVRNVFIQFIFLLGLQKIFFRSASLFVNAESKESELAERFVNWTIYLGESKIAYKPLLYTDIKGQGSFTKIAVKSHLYPLLHNESDVLEMLCKSNIHTFEFPDTLNTSHNTIELSDISQNGIRINEYSNLHTSVLAELNELTAFLTPLKQLDSWVLLKRDLEHLSKSGDEKLPVKLIAGLKALLETIDETIPTEVCLSHGDFTSWNMYEKNLKLHIYDWELSNPIKPLGFDAFHFIIQQGILIDKKNWSAIKQDIDVRLNENTFYILSKYKARSIRDYLKMYLLFNCVNYLTLYSRHASNHTRSKESLSVWTEAVDALMAAERVRSYA